MRVLLKTNEGKFDEGEMCAEEDKESERNEGTASKENRHAPVGFLASLEEYRRMRAR